MSIEPSRDLLEKPESRHYHLPSLLAPDKIALMFILSTVLGVIILFNVPNSSFEHFRYTIVFSFLAFISFAVSIGLTRRWLNRQAIWLATVIILFLAFAIVFCLHELTAAFVPIEAMGNIDLGRRLVFASVLVVGFLRYNYMQRSLHTREESELHARIQALQSRIRPHFLFDSMNIIASLIPVDPDVAETVVEDLSELFRASLQEEGSEVSIEEELALCRR